MARGQGPAGDDPLAILSHLHRRASERKFLLLACEFFRRFHAPDEAGLRAAGVLEGYAEGTVPYAEVVRARTRALRRRGKTAQLLFYNAIGQTTGIWREPFWRYHAAWQTLLELVRETLRRKPGRPSRETARAHERNRAFILAALRDVHGPPLHHRTADPAWLAWDGGTVARMARAAYDARDFAGLPILADALEEAGCTDRDVLAHCRSGGEHVRGCWALDLLLHKDESWQQQMRQFYGRGRD